MAWLIASCLVLLILFEIWRDRRTSNSLLSLSVTGTSLAVAILGLFIGETIADQGKYISTAIVFAVTILIGQGYYHQIKLILRSGQTGAVDLKMSQFILMMDISTIAFAITMGLKEGWPLLTLAITSAITKVIIMYLFRWVKTSDKAKLRRLASAKE